MRHNLPGQMLRRVHKGGFQNWPGEVPEERVIGAKVLDQSPQEARGPAPIETSQGDAIVELLVLGGPASTRGD